MSGLKRYTAILRLFTVEHPVWTVQDMALALAVPASTVYRLVRALMDEEWLASSGEAQYRIGAAFIEFERLLRLSDPFLRAGDPILRELAAGAGVPSVALLCRLYNDTVMCVADAGGLERLSSSYERGRPMPLMSGATSKAILAHLPARRLARLLGDQDAEQIRALRAELAIVRQKGFSVTQAEIDPDVLGIAVPLMTRSPGSLASLSLVLPVKSVNDTLRQQLIQATMTAAGRLEGVLVSERQAE